MTADLGAIVGERIRALRRERDMGQQDLANWAGISARAITYYETGAREPSLRSALRIARALDVALDAIVTVDDLGGDG